MLNAAQCRAGRALLNWSQDELSVNAQVARSTVTEFESNFRTPMKQNLLALQSALEAGRRRIHPRRWRRRRGEVSQSGARIQSQCKDGY